MRGKFKKYKVQCNHLNELVKKLDFRVATLVYVSLKYNWTECPLASTILINCIMHLTFYHSKPRILTRNHKETSMSLHSYIISKLAEFNH